MADKMDFIYRKKTASQRRGFTKAAEPPPRWKESIMVNKKAQSGAERELFWRVV